MLQEIVLHTHFDAPVTIKHCQNCGQSGSAHAFWCNGDHRTLPKLWTIRFCTHILMQRWPQNIAETVASEVLETVLHTHSDATVTIKHCWNCAQLLSISLLSKTSGNICWIHTTAYRNSFQFRLVQSSPAQPSLASPVQSSPVRSISVQTVIYRLMWVYTCSNQEHKMKTVRQSSF